MAYTPNVPPEFVDVSSLRQWIMEEFGRLAQDLQEMIAVELRPVNREPERPREGMVVYADGTNWDPGAGKGAYEYRGAAWFKL
jgi:hypothetical protein